ncbi:MAG: hypothetical protein C4305_00135, partial [Thermoleophilia bacterium]
MCTGQRQLRSRLERSNVDAAEVEDVRSSFGELATLVGSAGVATELGIARGALGYHRLPLPSREADLCQPRSRLCSPAQRRVLGWRRRWQTQLLGCGRRAVLV